MNEDIKPVRIDWKKTANEYAYLLSDTQLELEEAKKDTERMDFMEAYGGECICMLGSNFYYRSGFGQPNAKASSLRDAIDGAIKLRNRKNGL